MVVFSLLAFSTIFANNVSVGLYFVFLMLMVYGASLATGINQNGVFAYVTGFDREEYTQAIMVGQGVAGVLPCIVQILTVMAVPEPDSGGKEDDNGDGNGNGNSNSGDDKTHLAEISAESSKSAFIYFITATAVSALALVCFLHLCKRRPSHTITGGRDSNRGSQELHRETEEQLDFAENGTSTSTSRSGNGHERNESTVSHIFSSNAVPLSTLFWKLRWLSISVALCFAVTMVFPVFTAEIHSVHQVPPNPRIPYDASIFIPLAFLIWNLGDLIGRMAVAVPSFFRVAHTQPVRLFLLSIARLLFIPLYRLCNIHDRGATIESDFYYLFIVQLLFGISNGYVGSCCMMGAAYWVEEGEKEAAGGFMSLMLVTGLTIGSLFSFLVG